MNMRLLRSYLARNDGGKGTKSMKARINNKQQTANNKQQPNKT
jgi:hypothetical protein